MFGTTAALAAGSIRPSGAFAGHLRSDTPCPDSSKGCLCGPRFDGPFKYCTSYKADFCDGGKCAGGCRYNTEDWDTGCWCTKHCCNGNTRGYYHCCDCSCPTPSHGRRLCGCRAYRMTCPNNSGGTTTDGSGAGEIEIPIFGEADPSDALGNLFAGGPPCC